MGDKSCRFKVTDFPGGDVIQVDMGRGLGTYRYLLTYSEAKKLGRELLEAGKAAEERFVEHVNAQLADAARIPYHKKMMEEEKLREELERSSKLYDEYLEDASRHLGRSMGQKMEKEYMEAMGMTPWTDDPGVPWTAGEDRPDLIVADDPKEEIVSVDIEAPSDVEPITINIDLSEAEEKIKDLLAGISDNAKVEVGKAPETGRLPQGAKTNFKPEPACICFGPPVDDCPMHGKK